MDEKKLEIREFPDAKLWACGFCGAVRVVSETIFNIEKEQYCPTCKHQHLPVEISGNLLVRTAFEK